jgi:hypothetical protein
MTSLRSKVYLYTLADIDRHLTNREPYVSVVKRPFPPPGFYGFFLRWNYWQREHVSVLKRDRPLSTQVVRLPAF